MVPRGFLIGTYPISMAWVVRASSPLMVAPQYPHRHGWITGLLMPSSCKSGYIRVYVGICWPRGAWRTGSGGEPGLPGTFPRPVRHRRGMRRNGCSRILRTRCSHMRSSALTGHVEQPSRRSRGSWRPLQLLRRATARAEVGVLQSGRGVLRGLHGRVRKGGTMREAARSRVLGARGSVTADRARTLYHKGYMGGLIAGGRRVI